jgi:hypothetical protein
LKKATDCHVPKQIQYQFEMEQNQVLSVRVSPKRLLGVNKCFYANLQILEKLGLLSETQKKAKEKSKIKQAQLGLFVVKIKKFDLLTLKKCPHHICLRG